MSEVRDLCHKKWLLIVFATDSLLHSLDPVRFTYNLLTNQKQIKFRIESLDKSKITFHIK